MDFVLQCRELKFFDKFLLQELCCHFKEQHSISVFRFYNKGNLKTFAKKKMNTFPSMWCWNWKKTNSFELNNWKNISKIIPQVFLEGFYHGISIYMKKLLKPEFVIKFLFKTSIGQKGPKSHVLPAFKNPAEIVASTRHLLYRKRVQSETQTEEHEEEKGIQPCGMQGVFRRNGEGVLKTFQSSQWAYSYIISFTFNQTNCFTPILKCLSICCWKIQAKLTLKKTHHTLLKLFWT